MIDLSTKYLGLDLKNPLIAASSGLTDSVESIVKLEQAGAGAVVLKSLFEEEIIMDLETNMKKMSSAGFIYPETLEFYEHEDKHKEATTEYLKLIEQVKAKVSIPVIASINCVTAEQWMHFPKRLQEAGADAIELNLFILPSDMQRTAADSERVYFDILEQVKKRVNIPVSLKISYYFSNLGTMIQRLDKAGADGIVLFNRFYSPDFDIDKFEITSGSVLSHESDLALSLRWIAIMAGRVDADLAASTGVHSGSAVIKQLLAGAQVVQVASALYRHGHEHITEMLSDLENWMKSKNFTNIADFRGKMRQESSKNPAAYERVQFMKYFRGYQA